MTTPLSARLMCAVILGLFLIVVACVRQQKAPAPDPAVLLQSLPPADLGKYEHMADMRNWRNPYLVLRSNGVALLDTADNAEILLKPDEVLAELARLPASAWPYGRIVAVSESGARNSEQESVAIRRNKGIVGGILQGAHVAIDWGSVRVNLRS